MSLANQPFTYDHIGTLQSNRQRAPLLMLYAVNLLITLIILKYSVLSYHVIMQRRQSV